MKNIFVIKKIGIVAIISLLCTPAAYAQSEVNAQIERVRPKEFGKTPNAAAFEKFGDYQCTSYNGLPSISIPIFEVQSGSLKVPITLDYHASGVKLNEHASWVGLGWSLSAGGQISRQANGKRDEDEFIQQYTTPLKSGPLDVCENSTDMDYIRQIANGALDTRPDTWSYSFPGKSGKFLLRERQVLPPMLIPNEPFRINYSAGHVTIVDDAGTRYYYGTTSNGSNPGSALGLEGTNNGTDGGMTALYLMEMKAANSDDKILIGYQSIGQSVHNEVSETVQLNQNCNSNGQSGFECPPQSNGVIDSRITTTRTNSVAVETIFFESGKVEFKKSGTTRDDETSLNALDEILIYKLSGDGYVLAKKYKFYYSYFRNALDNADLRLKLDRLRAFDADGKAILSYGFSYQKYQSTDTYNRLPWRSFTQDKFSRDYWGYYNGPTGAGNQDLMLPVSESYYHQINSPALTTANFGTANRNVDTTYLKVGVLNRIDFPTGGYSTFEYEPNKYLAGGSPKFAGGLRIKRIKSSDGVHDPLIKEYRYGTSADTQSSYGFPNFDPEKFQYWNIHEFVKKCCGSGMCGLGEPGSMTYVSKTWYSNVSYNSEGYGGSAVVYPYVTEYIKNTSGEFLGRTTYEYDNGNYIPPGVAHRPVNYAGGTISGVSTQTFINSTAWKAGFLTKKIVQDSTWKTVATTTIAYTVYNEQTDVHVGWLAEFIRTYTQQECFFTSSCPSGADPLTVAFTPVEQTTGAIRETSRTERTYDADGIASIAKTTTTVFDAARLQPTKNTTQKSGTARSVVEMVYPFHYSTNASSSGLAETIYKLTEQNAISVPIERYSYVENAGSKRLAVAQLTTFKINENNEEHVVPNKIFFLESNSVISVASGGFVPSSIHSNNSDIVKDLRYRERIAISKYDASSKPIVIAKTKDVPTSYIYGYGNRRAIAEVINAQNVSGSPVIVNPMQVTEAVTVIGPTTNSVQMQKTFTTSLTGTVTLKLGVSGNPSYSTVASWTGITSGSATLQKGNCGLNTITFSNVPANTYTLTITLTTPDSGVEALSACGEITFIGETPQGINEALVVNFEEMSGANIQTNMVAAHSGSKYWQGDYLVTFTPPNSRNYKIEYWYFNDGKWKWMSMPYTGSSMLLSNGTAIDDIRIYPADAQMKTYTYDLLNGLTSTIGENGKTLLYDYDAFGRLWRVRNDEGTVEKQISYHYNNN